MLARSGRPTPPTWGAVCPTQAATQSTRAVVVGGRRGGRLRQRHCPMRFVRAILRPASRVRHILAGLYRGSSHAAAACEDQCEHQLPRGGCDAERPGQRHSRHSVEPPAASMASDQTHTSHTRADDRHAWPPAAARASQSSLHNRSDRTTCVQTDCARLGQ